MKTTNGRWLVTFVVLALLASSGRAFAQSVLGEPPEQRVLPVVSVGANRFGLLAAQPAAKVRIVYLIPSNREAQPHAVQILQRYALRVQTLYRENMARQGHGEKTLTFETEPDGIIPKVNVAHIPQTDSQLQSPDYNTRWGNILNAAATAGFPPFQQGEALWVIPEMHEQLPDGTFSDSGAFVGGAGGGTTSGAAVVSSDFLARMSASFLTDNRNYQGLVIPTLGPFPLVVGASFPAFEGTTLSSTSSSAQGAAAHELGHAFSLPHDFTNDNNFFGNLMGNGLRGFRGFFYPDQYPDSSVDLSAGSALQLSTSPFFNAPPLSGPAPQITLLDDGTVNGLVRFDFRATGNALAGIVLLRNGDAVASKPLSGTSVTTSITTYDYSPGVKDTWEFHVYDSQSSSNATVIRLNFVPTVGANRAPFPSIRLSKSRLVAGDPVVLDATRSFDPDGDTSQIKVEWDLNGDGIFDTPPSLAKQLTTSYATPGTYRVAARLTDGRGDASISSPIGIRVEPAIVNDLVTFAVTDSGFSADATGCPSEYAGTFSINALLTNRSKQELSHLRIGITTLTEGVLLVGTNTMFEQGEFLDPPNVPNQRLSSGDTASVPLTLCLEKRAPFEFFVNVHALTN